MFCVRFTDTLASITSTIAIKKEIGMCSPYFVRSLTWLFLRLFHFCHPDFIQPAVYFALPVLWGIVDTIRYIEIDGSRHVIHYI